jgi:hypothetical protein
MILLFFPSVVVAIAIGWCLTSLAWAPPKQFGIVFLCRLSLSIGLGLAACSVIYYLWILAFGSPSPYFITAEVAVALGLLALLFRRRSAKVPVSASLRPSARSTPNWWLRSGFALVLAAGAVTLALVARQIPQGGFDAWTSWNLHARVLFRGGWPYWVGYARLAATHHRIDTMHMDYPLLVPANVARGWTYVGRETVLVPISLAMLFTLATIGLLVASLSLLRTESQALIAGIVLVGTPFFLRHGASQYADVPLSFFILATLALFSLYDRGDRNSGLLVLAGLSAGFAAWTKNEGVLFVVLILFVRSIVVWFHAGWQSYRRQMVPLAAGLLPILAIVAMFKLQAPSFYLLTGARSQGLMTTLHRTFDLSRYAMTAWWFKSELFEAGFGGWIVNLLLVLPFYALLLGATKEQDDSTSLITASATLFLMAAGYFMVFVVSPDISVSLADHIAFALNRLLLQLWPSTIFALFLFMNTPETAGRSSEKGNMSVITSLRHSELGLTQGERST